MQPRNIVVLAIDRLGAGYLGPYGATWLDTPAFNHLASQSLLIEHALSDSPELARVYRSLWTGRHAANHDEPAAPLAKIFSAAGYQTSLLTDDAEVANSPLAVDFQRRFEPLPGAASSTAADVADTQLARMFDTAIEMFSEASSPFLLWVHLQAMQGPWDAPWELRAQWADEEDPSPPEFVDPPLRRLPATYDPDEVLGVIHAYAGQVAVLDRCLGWFLQAFESSSRALDTLLVVTAPRGYPLGEHHRIGPVNNALHGELLHIPLLLRFPAGLDNAFRAQAIAQPADVFATLTDWAQVTNAPTGIWGQSLMRLTEDEEWRRDRAVAVYGDERSLRTPAWFLRRPATTDDSSEPVELYVKPDDRWEANEVSDRLPEIVEAMLATLDDFERAAQAGDPALLTPLAEELCVGVE